MSESDKDHLDDVDAILASLEAQHGISLPDEIKENRSTPADAMGLADPAKDSLLQSSLEVRRYEPEQSYCQSTINHYLARHLI